MTSTTKKTFHFSIPNDFRESTPPIYDIGIDGNNWIIQFKDSDGKLVTADSTITGYKQSDLESLRSALDSKLFLRFDTAAVAFVCRRVVEVVDKLCDKEASYPIDRIKKLNEREAAKLDGENNGGEVVEEKPIYPVKKYSGPEVNGLAEAVLIKGEPFFAKTVNQGDDIELSQTSRLPI